MGGGRSACARPPGDGIFPTIRGGTGALPEPIDPADCVHERSCRLGIQRFPFPPYRVYLLRCLFCETTLTTGTLREFRSGRGGGRRNGPPGR
jgi:hypothetical protein